MAGTAKGAGGASSRAPGRRSSIGEQLERISQKKSGPFCGCFNKWLRRVRATLFLAGFVLLMIVEVAFKIQSGFPISDVTQCTTPTTNRDFFLVQWTVDGGNATGCAQAFELMGGGVKGDRVFDLNATVGSVVDDFVFEQPLVAEGFRWAWAYLVHTRCPCTRCTPARCATDADEFMSGCAGGRSALRSFWRR